MSDQGEVEFNDGDVVWVKLGNCWWPGVVVGKDKLPSGLLTSFRKPPIAVVQFFQEDTYEYVKNKNLINKYNCEKKSEFIKKGLDSYRSKHAHMEKFPEDVIRAETATGGDVEILTRDEFQEQKKESYKNIFGDSSSKKNLSKKRGRPSRGEDVSTPVLKRTNSKESDYRAHILVQGSGSAAGEKIEKPCSSDAASPNLPAPAVPSAPSPATSHSPASTPGVYTCHACQFSTHRLNVIIMHNKTHSSSYIPYTPSPVKKPTSKVKDSSTPTTAKVRKVKNQSAPKKRGIAHVTKRVAESFGETVVTKKPKTDAEIKKSLLADWDDAEEEIANDDSISSDKKPENDNQSISSTNNTTYLDNDENLKNVVEPNDSRFEFCEEEDWPAKKDGNRRIPRVKNTRVEDTTVDEFDLSKEVTELLETTKVPQIPSAPDSLISPENFPEADKAKTPDKSDPKTPESKKANECEVKNDTKKVIFKTKTFFRSRHSRSQDAIEKYIAEQLNPVERLDSLESTDANGDAVQVSIETPELDSVPPVKVSRLAPKIQLKKLKAEAKLKKNLSVSNDNGEVEADEKSNDVYLQVDEVHKTIHKSHKVAEKMKSKDILPDPSLDLRNVTHIEQTLMTDLSTKSVYTPKYVGELSIKPTNISDDSKNFGSESGTDLSVETEIKSTMADENTTEKNYPITKGNVEQTIKQLKINHRAEENIESTTKQSKVYLETEENIEPTIKRSKDYLETEVNVEPSIKQSNDYPEAEVNVEPTMKQSKDYPVTDVNVVPTMKQSKDYPGTDLNVESTAKQLKDSPGTEPNVEPTLKQGSLLDDSLCSNIAEIIAPSVNNDEENCAQSSLDLSEQSTIKPTVVSDEISDSINYSKSDIGTNNYNESICSNTIDEKNQLKYECNEFLNTVNSDSKKSITEAKISDEYLKCENEVKNTDAITCSEIKNNPNFDTAKNNLPTEFESSINSYAILPQLKGTISNSTTDISSLCPTSYEAAVDPTITDNATLLDKITDRLEFDTKLNKKSTSENVSKLSESTATAVDALLSVSLNKDRLPNHISSGLPDNIFQEDTKIENESVNIVEGETDINSLEENLNVSVSIKQDYPTDSDKNLTTLENVHKLRTETVICSSIVPCNNVVDVVGQTKNELNVINNNEHVTDNYLSNNLTSSENAPSECDLQIAEALINMPSTAIKNSLNDIQSETVLTSSVNLNDLSELSYVDANSLAENKLSSDSNITKYFNDFQSSASLCDISSTKERIQVPEKTQIDSDLHNTENFKAAECLVQMSETYDQSAKNNESLPSNLQVMQEQAALVHVDKAECSNNEIVSKIINPASVLVTKANSGSNPPTSRLLQILEDCKPEKPVLKKTSPKMVNQRILNFEGTRSMVQPQPTKQKIIIRRATPAKKTLPNLDPVQDKIIISRSNNPSTINTFKIETPALSSAESSTIIIQQQRAQAAQAAKSPAKKVAISKSKPQVQTSILLQNDKPANDLTEDLFDINSMPVVLSDQILTPESIEKMPVIISDVNIAPGQATSSLAVQCTAEAVKPANLKPAKNEPKTLLINAATHKPAAPNILSKSMKGRVGKPLLVFDKHTGKQKLLVAQQLPAKDTATATATATQPNPPNTKADKIIILPSTSSHSPRTQKIVIDPKTGKAHMLVSKPTEGASSLTLPNRIAPKPMEATASGAQVPASPQPHAGVGTGAGTVMIITNAQGAQSRIVLTPEHEKLLFPNNPTNTLAKQSPGKIQTLSPIGGHKQQIIVKSIQPSGAKPSQQRVVAKPKGAIITSKGQLLVPASPGAGPASPLVKRTLTAVPDPTKIISKAKTTEPLIYLQQKSGAVIQLTAAQFEHLQKTGQIVQKAPVQQQRQQQLQQPRQQQQVRPQLLSQKVVPKLVPDCKRPRAPRVEIQTQSRKPKIEIKSNVSLPKVGSGRPRMGGPSTTVPPPLVPVSSAPAPGSTPGTAPAPGRVPCVVSSVPAAPPSRTGLYAELDNFEELLPSTAIARAPEPPPPPPPVPAPAPQEQAAGTQLTDGQLLAVAGESFGGPPGSFYLCVEDSGTLTPIDNRPLVLENNQLVPMLEELAPEPAPAPLVRPLLLVGGEGPAVAPPEMAPAPAPAHEHRDILAAALANTDVFRAENGGGPGGVRDEGADLTDFRELNAAVSVQSVVSETSSTLHQPIMTPVELPSQPQPQQQQQHGLEAGLAVLGLCAPAVPTSLELPITVTDPRIATAPALGAGAALGVGGGGGGGMSMPLLCEEEEPCERLVSSVESCEGGESGEGGEGAGAGAGGQQLRTPPSPLSEGSAELPPQPALQLRAADLVPPQSAPTHTPAPALS